MDAIPDNAILPLVDRRGKLIESFAGFSDGHIRQALAQLIDGLERMDELADGVDSVVQNWRKAKPNDEAWRREVSRKLRPTPIVPPPDDRHYGLYQWQDAAGKDCKLADMSREDMETGIRQAWEFSRRFARMFNAGAREARNILSGAYVQAEWDKPEPEAPTTRRSPRP